jgi:hypothetical protein
LIFRPRLCFWMELRREKKEKPSGTSLYLILPSLLFILFVRLDVLIHFVCLIASYRSVCLLDCIVSVLSRSLPDCIGFFWTFPSLDCHSERFSLFLTDTKPFPINILWTWIGRWANCGTRLRAE